MSHARKCWKTNLGLHASLYCPLLDATIVTMLCDKNSETVHGKPALDVCTTKNCSLFLDYPVSMTMTEVPTKTFTFKCTRPLKQRQAHANPLRAMMVQRNLAYIHLPPPRMRGVMTGKDELYNDIRSYFEVKGV